MTSTIDCRYLGLPLRSPVVVGACPLTIMPESLRQLIHYGAGAVVLPSLFQEQIEQRPLPVSHADSREFLQAYNGGPESYLHLLQEAKQSAPIPVIANLNGYGCGDWLDFARQIQNCGADAIELNLQPNITGPEPSSEQIEADLAEVVVRLCATVTMPVAVKMSRHYTNPASVARRLHQAGAAGLVLFAREVTWDVALDRLHWTSHWELTPIDSLGATLAGIIQTRSAQLPISFAASGGIRSAEDAAKAMLVGADVVMIASELYRTGPSAIRAINLGLERYLETSGFASLAEFHAARPRAEGRSLQDSRYSYLDPLTRTHKYHDPTPDAAQPTGDRYGHKD